MQMEMQLQENKKTIETQRKAIQELQVCVFVPGFFSFLTHIYIYSIYIYVFLVLKVYHMYMLLSLYFYSLQMKVSV